MEEKSPQLDEIHEESESDSSESELSSGTDVDPDYNPDPSESSSSEVEIRSPDTGSSCEKLCIEDLESPDTNLSEDDDQQKGCVCSGVMLLARLVCLRALPVTSLRSSLTQEDSGF